MVGLDGGVVGTTRFDDVGVEGALDEVSGVGELGGDFLEDADERRSDDLAFLFGIGHAGERGQEPVGGFDVDEIDVELASERLLDLVGFAEAEQPGVDEDAGQLIPDGLVHERRRDGRVDTAGEATHDASVADLVAHTGDGFVDDRRVRPRWSTAADVEQEGVQHLAAPFGVEHLGVELDAEQGPVAVLVGRHRGAGRRGGHDGPLRGGADRVAVAHPDGLVTGDVGEEQRPGVGPGHRGAPVFAASGAADVPTELQRRELRAVADAENRYPGAVNVGVDRRGTVDMDRRGTSGEDDPPGSFGQHLVEGHSARHDLGVHARLADATGDQLGVLGPEVDNENGVVLRRQWPGLSGPCRCAARVGAPCLRS